MLVEPGAVLAWIVDADGPVANELKEVLVDRHDRDLMACFRRPRRHRSNHIVGLIARLGDDGNAQCLARLVDPVDLLDQIVGHLRAIGLVVGRDRISKGRAGQIERGGDERRVVVGEQFPQHRHEDVDRVRGLALLIRQPAPAKRVVRAIHL